MNRFPSGTPYAGPTMCYDDMIDPEQLMRRLVYGMAAPLLGFGDRLTTVVYAKLIDELSNSHGVLVKAAPAPRTAQNLATKLRRELPSDLVSISVIHAPERNEWMVMAYNSIPRRLRTLPAELSGRGSKWIDTTEVARILNISPRQAANVVTASGVEQKRVGGLNRIMVQQRDLIVLANRPRRWRKKRPKVSV